MRNFLKVIMIVFLIGILAACMNSNDNNTSPQPNETKKSEENETNNEQNQDEVEQADPSELDETNSNETETEQDEPDDQNEANQDEIVVENDAFKIYQPAPEATLSDQIVVRGLARVFEGTVQYEFEDGHFIFDKGHTTASKAGPEWGEFTINIPIDASIQGDARLVIYEQSAKDGSKVNEITIPVHIE